ncbi:MAG: hypothetical protein KF830_10890 [Planctomycetes bacterium]|nr:hypothetical protein [Planctomycetota bacterium]
MPRPLPFVLLLCLGGCLEFEQTVTLEADGSGRQAVVMTLREAALEDLRRTAGAAQLGAVSNPSAVFERDLVAAELAPAGMELLRHVTRRTAVHRTVELEAAFPDFAALQRSPLCGTGAEWVLGAGPRPGTAKLTLYPQGRAAWTEARAKAESLAASTDPVAADFFRKRRQQLAGLDVVVRLRLPGDVLVWTRNLEKTGDREVTARITADKLGTPEELIRWLAPRFEVIFDATGCKLPL